MRIFHLGDLHIGKVVNNFSMIEDQKKVLNQVKEYIKEHKPDAVILAGDIYDRSIPPSKAVSLFNSFLTDVLINLNKTVIAVAGNHDNADLIEFGSEVFAKANFYIEGTFNKDIRKVILQDKYGPVNFYLIPFADYAIVRDAFNNTDIKSLNESMQCIVDKIMDGFDNTQRNVIVTHAYVIGGEDPETCESEKKLVMGGKEYVQANLFDKFDYVALGHLHRAQKIGSNKIRYSGSLLKYSFSEENHKKSITMLDMNEDGEIKIELLNLNIDKNMRTIEGTLDDLLDPKNYTNENKNDYMRIILTDDGELVEPMAKLRQVYPNIMLLEIKRELGELTSSPLSSKSRKEKTTKELFKDFYKYHMQDELHENGIDIIDKIIKALDKELN